MVTYHNGDLLESGCCIIAHQVNLSGVMGGGLALQIARKYPHCEAKYKERAKNPITLGEVFYCNEGDTIIANCFTQDIFYNTNYSAVEKAFMKLRAKAEEIGGVTIGIPYGYGCGIANGNWSIVEEIILKVFCNTNIDCQIWKFKDNTENEQDFETT